MFLTSIHSRTEAAFPTGDASFIASLLLGFEPPPPEAEAATATSGKLAEAPETKSIHQSEGALVGVQGCTAPPFFKKHHITPPNFEQSLDNAPQDHLVTIIFEFPIKLCTPVFKFVTQTL